MEHRLQPEARESGMLPRSGAVGEAKGEQPAPRGKRRYWTAQRKAKLVMELLSRSTPATEICRREGISPSMLYQWRDRFMAGAERALLGRGLSAEEERLRMENEQLRHAVADLTVERDLLEKKTPWTTLPRRRKSGG
jgi:transposase-like protein